MGVVTQMASLPFGGHDGGIWIGRTDHEVSHAPIAAPHDLPIRFSPLLDPVMTLLIGRGQVLTERSFQGSRQLHRSHDGRGARLRLCTTRHQQQAVVLLSLPWRRVLADAARRQSAA